jgi:uncharacterized protein YgfB (UPF0149 family)
MKTLSFDVEGLTEDQIELARQFVELMKRSGECKEAVQDLRKLIQKGVQGGDEISEEEASRIASEAVAFARGRR